jgi:D-alanyl-D-alanine carboxypeptidase
LLGAHDVEGEHDDERDLIGLGHGRLLSRGPMMSQPTIAVRAYPVRPRRIHPPQRIAMPTWHASVTSGSSTSQRPLPSEPSVASGAERADAAAPRSLSHADNSHVRRLAGLLLALALIAVALVGVGMFGAAAPSPATRAAAVESSPPGASLSPPGASSSLQAAQSSAPPPATIAGAPSPTIDGVPIQALDALVARYVRQTHVPGVSVTIRWADGQTWTGTAGYANVADRLPVRADTAFAAASISKTFTSALILQLVEEHRLALDDPARRWLDPAIAKAADVGAKVTVRMLLDHTSGLKDFFFGPGIDAALQRAPDRAWTAVDALTFVRGRYFRPGAGWHYSNTNYLLLGLIAERVAGQPLARALRQRFFDPLAMHDTWYQAVESARAEEAHGYRLTGSGRNVRAQDLSDGDGIMPFRSVVTAADGAGSIATTSRDLTTWAAALYGGSVLTPESKAALLGDVATTAKYHPTVPYGLGVQALRIGRFDTLGHSGRLLGFRGALRYVPALGLAIAVLTNQNKVDVTPLIAHLLEVAVPLPVVCLECP